MPVTTNYPGVYIEEVPSGVRTITGVATSIAAFIGRALRGPIDSDRRAPVTITSYADFERTFGGLWLDSTLGYAVRDFFLNGGSQAIVVRVHQGATAATFNLATGGAAPNDLLSLQAASVGAWGARLSIAVDHKTRDASDTKLFNLTVVEKDGTRELARETFLNVSIDPTSARFVPRVLEESSSLVRVPPSGSSWTVPNVRPQPNAAIAANAGTASDGNAITGAEITGSASLKTGLYALEKADLFNLLCLPPPTPGGDTPSTAYSEALDYCVRRRALLLVDSPAAWGANPASAAGDAVAGLATLSLTGERARNAALFFPRVRKADPLRENQIGEFVPCGIVAGIFARTDAERGVWKAPAGLDAALNGTAGLQVNLTDGENGQLNPLAVNCLRSFPVAGRVVWGARTMRGADVMADEYKYVPVRRLTLFLEETLYRGTQWVVFEPNDEPLWSQIRLNLGAFMHGLFRRGAFQGSSPREAYFVKCDRETTTQADINNGIVNIHVGFAPLKPAEFVVIRIQQIAGQLET